VGEAISCGLVFVRDRLDQVVLQVVKVGLVAVGIDGLYEVADRVIEVP
jgi:hypothetical protein